MNLKAAIYLQTIAFLAAIFGAFVFVAIHLWSPEVRASLSGMGWPQIADGTLAKKLDAAVIAAIPESRRLNGFQAGVEYRVFDDAGPQVRAGCFGWLFLGEEVLEVPGGEENMRRRLELARRFAQTFAKRNITLVMLTVPDKARMAASDLCGQHVSPQSQERLAQWAALTASLPMPKVDIYDEWPGKPGYWRTDTHWDLGGAQFAAKRTAAVVDAVLRVRGSETATVSEAAGLTARPGDLMRLSNLSNAPGWLQPPPDMQRVRTVVWHRSGGLLDAGPAADVLLAGSSYSRNSNFLDDLSIALGQEVVQVSLDGSGFDGSLLALLSQHKNDLAQAKVVVWEFPERSLTQPLTDQERAFAGSAETTAPGT